MGTRKKIDKVAGMVFEVCNNAESLGEVGRELITAAKKAGAKKIPKHETDEFSQQVEELRKAEDEKDLCYMEHSLHAHLTSASREVIERHLSPFFAGGGASFRYSKLLKWEHEIFSGLKDARAFVLKRPNYYSLVLVPLYRSGVDSMGDRKYKKYKDNTERNIIRIYDNTSEGLVITEPHLQEHNASLSI